MTDTQHHQAYEARLLAARLLGIAPAAEGHPDRVAAIATLLLQCCAIEQGTGTMADTDRAQQDLARVWPGWWEGD